MKIAKLQAVTFTKSHVHVETITVYKHIDREHLTSHAAHDVLRTFKLA
jgi:hypothetical protein